MTFEADYIDLRDNLVEVQIAEFGKPATLTQPGPTTGPDYDPIPGTPVVTPVTVMELGPPGSSMAAMNQPGTNLRHDDLRFMMSTDGDPVPTLDGTLTVDGSVLQIVGIVANRTGPVTMFWKVRCAR